MHPVVKKQVFKGVLLLRVCRFVVRNLYLHMAIHSYEPSERQPGRASIFMRSSLNVLRAIVDCVQVSRNIESDRV